MDLESFLTAVRGVTGFEWKRMKPNGRISGSTDTGRILAADGFSPITAVVWAETGEYWPPSKELQAGMEKLALGSDDATLIIVASNFAVPWLQLENPDDAAAARNIRERIERATLARAIRSKPPRPPKAFEPAVLSYRDRYNVGALFSCLFNATRDDSGKELEILRKLFTRLGLAKKDQSGLIKWSSKSMDPAPWAEKISDQNVRWMLVWDLLVLALETGAYDAREREGLRRLAGALRVAWHRVRDAEDGLCIEVAHAMAGSAEKAMPSPYRWWKVAAVTLAGGVVVAATAGLAAPAIGGAIGTYFMGLSGAAATSAGLAALGGGAVAAGGGGIALGTQVVGGVLFASGGSLAGYKMHKRTAAVSEFGFERIGGKGMHTLIAVSGFLSEKADLVNKWTALGEVAGHGTHYTLRWESQHLVALGAAFTSFSAKHLGRRALEYWAKRATRLAGEALRWPALVLHAADIIDNPWSIAKDRAEKAGVHLAEALIDNAQGGRPVSLIGFSLGARVIFFALEHLAAKKASGIVDHAILLGAAAPGDSSRWANAKSVVAGRLVNGFSTSDWILGLLYRSAAFTNDVAGLRAVDSTVIENIDLTKLVPGHLNYSPVSRPMLQHLRAHEL